jgi:D-alanyl-D-alanine endopeptidase (penicillin-binding protein 7)
LIGVRAHPNPLRAAACGALVGLLMLPLLVRAATRQPDIRSAHAFVVDDTSQEVLFQRDPETPQPIASISKLMLAMVVLDTHPDMTERITLVPEDKPHIKFTRSRLPIGTVISRGDLLRAALVASDNRAAQSLARTYPGGVEAAVAAMNRKASALGLTLTHFGDPTGLDAGNVSTARELAKLVAAARSYPVISAATSSGHIEIPTSRGTIKFNNTDALVRGHRWSIDLSKTGYISEAGRCLVIHARIGDRPLTVVLLGANGKYTTVGDAARLRQWLEHSRPRPALASAQAPGTSN